MFVKTDSIFCFLRMNFCLFLNAPSIQIVVFKSLFDLKPFCFPAGALKELLPYTKGAISPSAETPLAGLSSISLIGTAGRLKVQVFVWIISKRGFKGLLASVVCRYEESILCIVGPHDLV